MHRKRLLCWKAYLPRSSWPTQPTTPIICARPSLPKARSPSSPTTRHGRSNIRSTSISMPSAISWSAASQNSNNSAASQPVSKRQPEITLPSSLSQPSSYGCDKCPHHLVFVRLAHDRRFVGGAVLFVLVLVLFVLIRISGRHRVAHDHEGTPVDQPGGKFLGDVWGHVVAPRVWTLGDFTPSAVIRHANLTPLALQELGAFGRIDSPILNQQFYPALGSSERSSGHDSSTNSAP